MTDEPQPISTHRRGIDPRRCLGWCLFPAGAEWREVERLGDNWSAYGMTQHVTHRRPFPPPPTDAPDRR